MVEEAIQFDRDLIGVEYPGGTFTITKELIKKFCQAVGEDNPIFTSEEAARRAGFKGLVAPPTMCVGVSSVTYPKTGLERGRHKLAASSSMEFLVPVIEGDTLEARIRLKDVYTKTGRSGTMVFIVWVTTFTNQRGEKVAAVQQSYAARK